jgi:hypothetical protein
MPDVETSPEAAKADNAASAPASTDTAIDAANGAAEPTAGSRNGDSLSAATESGTEAVQTTVALPAPQLLVRWSSRWDEFRSSLRPALARPPKALAGEAPVGMFPYRGMLGGWLLEFLLFLAFVVLPAKFISLELPLPPSIPQRDVIYFSGDELPQTEDRGGAQAGRTGRAGGQQAHHRTQTIRVTRGDRPGERVVDAPKLNLPRSNDAVANLLAFKSNPGPPPAEGLRSKLVAPVLPQLSVVEPTAELTAASSRAAQALTPNIVAPAPDVSHANTRNAPALSSSVVAPAPDVARANTRNAPTLNSSVIAPAPNVSRDMLRSAEPLVPNVVAPAPRDMPRDLAGSRTPLSQTVDVIQPPVSAPVRDSAAKPKMTLPAPAVVAPPPSVSREINSFGSANTGDLRSKAVPVPPPPSAPSAASGSMRMSTQAGKNGFTPQVVPPPASISQVDGAVGSRGSAKAGEASSPLLGENDVIPPPPGLGGGKASSGTGRGNKGNGTGSPFDLGSSVAPPTNAGGNTMGSGVVVSSQPGTKVGLPNSSGGSAIAMSPSGSANSGLGGNGGGAGIGKGNGPGSGFEGEGSGAGREGVGRGSDPNAHAGISPYPGPGGAGTGTAGQPAMPGVSVEGGTTTITLPSFGAAESNGLGNAPGRSNANSRGAPGYTVKATSSSGGVFNRYGQLKGDNYSIYIDTSLGTAVMQYADAASAARGTTGDLTAPQPLRDGLPSGLHTTYVVFACILDRSGNLKDIKVLEPGSAETTSKILAALHNWKFRPAFRGNDPVEVNAFLGFGIDTR